MTWTLGETSWIHDLFATVTKTAVLIHVVLQLYYIGGEQHYEEDDEDDAQ